ncbi:MAG: hypothetical protein BroJett040_19100 [Oligoflexia bacterium]|nr:MAG: hypothetical protein BroJett040_19100 [Oligoflexia bacterium]
MSIAKIVLTLALPILLPVVSEAGKQAISDGVSQKDIVQIAVGSKDHTTLVTALKAADYVDVLANPGPFTVFAPTNAAFDKLPKGTVEGLVKPEKKAVLRNILEHHVAVGVFTENILNMMDGSELDQANGDKVKIAVKNGKLTVGGANVLAAIKASNGMVYVIDTVLLPPEKAKK